MFGHFNLPSRAVAEVLHHVTPSSLLFGLVQLLSPLCLCAFPCVSFNLLLFPPPSHRHPPLRSASCGLIVAPAHTSARHEAVRVWLESVSGGSADLKGMDASRLGLGQLGLFLQRAQAHNCVTRKHARCTAVALRVFSSPVWPHVLTSSKVLTRNLSLFACGLMRIHSRTIGVILSKLEETDWESFT